MFKYKFIKAKQQKTIHHSLVDLISSPFPCLQENHDGINNQYTLVLMDEDDQAVVGGATLTQSDLAFLQEDIRGFLPMEAINSPYVWECSSLYFAQSDLLPFSLQEDFYHYLYEGLVAFGKQKQAGFVVVKLTPEAYLPTKELGLWPYIIQLLPPTCPDDLFYGILPLRGCFYEAYKEQRKEIEGCLDYNKVSLSL